MYQFAPAWIKAYEKSEEFWPIYWDRAVLKRLLLNQEACSRLDTLWRQDEETALTLLEASLAMRGIWEGMPKYSLGEQEKVVSEARTLAAKLSKILRVENSPIQAYFPLPITIETLIPTRSELPKFTPAATILGRGDISLILDCLIMSLQNPAEWDDDFLLPDRPKHRNAFRTFSAQSLIRIFRRKLGRPNYSLIAELANLIVEAPDDPIHSTHVAKLDQYT